MDPTSAPTVRVARAADADVIGEIHVVSWQSAYAGQIPDDYLNGLSIADRRRRWRTRLQRPTGNGHVLVVEAEHQVTGFSLAGPSRDDDATADTAELYAIYVHPEHQGRGEGRALHDRAITMLRAEGYRLATLWVLTTNERARGFYERMGWHADGATKTETLGDTDVNIHETRYERTLLA
jgi:ribosomal protein S18 acetylase RimI-like enzyme